MEYLKKLKDLTSYSFPYEIKEQIHFDNNLPCLLKKGKDKNTKRNVLLFINNGSKEERRNEFKQLLSTCKSLIHPYLLRYVHDLEKTDIYLITENAIPLELFLQNNTLLKVSLDNVKKYGVYCISKGLEFLHHSCKMVHKNLKKSSIYVTNSLDWKIFDLNFCEKMKNQKDLYDNLDDFFKTIFEIFNEKMIGNKPFIDSFQNYKNNKSYDITQFISETISNGTLDIKYIHFMIHIENIMIIQQENRESIIFNFSDILLNLPLEIIFYKIIPIFNHLITLKIHENILEPIITHFTGEILLKDDKIIKNDESILKELILNLYESNNRQTRKLLLKYFENTIILFKNDSKLIENKIYNCYLKGLFDTDYSTQYLSVVNSKYLVKVISKNILEQKLIPIFMKIANHSFNDFGQMKISIIHILFTIFDFVSTNVMLENIILLFQMLHSTLNKEEFFDSLLFLDTINLVHNKIESFTPDFIIKSLIPAVSLLLLSKQTILVNETSHLLLKLIKQHASSQKCTVDKYSLISVHIEETYYPKIATFFKTTSETTHVEEEPQCFSEEWEEWS